MTAANCERFRHSTAAEPLPGPRPAHRARRSPIQAATCAASSSTVGSRATSTRPSPAPGAADSSRTGTLDEARSGAAVWLATSSTDWSLRQLVDSCSTWASASSRKRRGKRLRVVALAPRQP